MRNITTFFENGKAAAGYVEDILRYSEFASQSTMTITPEKSGGYSVTIATDMSSDDTEQEQVAQFFSQTQVNI